MIDDTKLSGLQERELSMDEILSSIRNIITEDQEKPAGIKRTFPENSTTNPSGARMLDELPTFESKEMFSLPDFKEELGSFKADTQRRTQAPVFQDESFETRHRNETSLKEQSKPFHNQEHFNRDAAASEDRISHALRGIVESYGNLLQKESVQREELLMGNNKMNEIINQMIEKIVSHRVEEWLHAHLPEILEKAIIRELERIAHKMHV